MSLMISFFVGFHRLASSQIFMLTIQMTKFDPTESLDEFVFILQI